ncbi:MAG: beta-propeller fold lactonase family protein [Candidatus Sulfotelmatobacter sp.]|jgi:6-phosphogluconolactonase (cycloisomerase 2 family)
MLQKALVLLFVFASIAGCIGCGTTTSHYVYATLPAANELAVYREDPNSGVLTELAGSPYSVGDGARSLVLHPSGRFLYAANPGQEENDISLFTIASDGSLTEVFPRTSVAPNGSLPQLLAMDPAGGFLYVANAGSSNISVFMIDPNAGSLLQVAGSPFTLGLTPLNMQLTPSGSYLYVTAASEPLGYIAVFSVNAGVLQLVSLTSSNGVNPTGLAIDPSGTYLYAANSSSNSLAIYMIGSSGGLTQVTGSPLADIYNDPVSLLLDPSGQYLYVANQTSNNVAVYSIDSTSGLPVALTTSTSTFAFSTESSPSFLAEDPNGAYLFVGNQAGSAGIQAFGLNAGNLNPLFTYGVGNSPTSIAVLQ